MTEGRFVFLLTSEVSAWSGRTGQVFFEPFTNIFLKGDFTLIHMNFGDDERISSHDAVFSRSKRVQPFPNGHIL